MEDFVSFEIAKKLKEKGFKEESFARYYCSDKAYFERNSYHPNTESIFYCYNNDEDLGRFYIDAPTIPQVLKWLREEKKIYIMVDRSFSVRGWHYYIIDDDDFENPIQQEVEHNRCYEQAAIDAIEYVLDNII